MLRKFSSSPETIMMMMMMIFSKGYFLERCETASHQITQRECEMLFLKGEQIISKRNKMSLRKKNCCSELTKKENNSGKCVKHENWS